MNREWITFVYSSAATRDDLLTDEDWRRVEWQLLQNPRAGDVIPGLAGARKLRVRLQGRGKRGGARTIYLYVTEHETIYFLATYAKSEQSDLTPSDTWVLRALIERIKQGAN